MLRPMSLRRARIGVSAALLMLGGCAVVPVVGVLGAGESAHRVGEERGWIERGISPVEAICTDLGIERCASFDVDVPGVR